MPQPRKPIRWREHVKTPEVQDAIRGAIKKLKIVGLAQPRVSDVTKACGNLKLDPNNTNVRAEVLRMMHQEGMTPFYVPPNKRERAGVEAVQAAGKTAPRTAETENESPESWIPPNMQKNAQQKARFQQLLPNERTAYQEWKSGIPKETTAKQLRVTIEKLFTLRHRAHHYIHQGSYPPKK